MTSKKKLFVAFSKHHLEKALSLSANYESKIIYIGNLKEINSSSSVKILAIRSIKELELIKINKAYNCYVFAMQPHLSFIKFLINIRGCGGIIIHLEETHQLEMHQGLANTFQLIPDAILLASKGEYLSYKDKFPNNSPFFLKHGWIFHHTSNIESQTIPIKKIPEIIILFSAPQKLSILSAENYQQRLLLIEKIKSLLNRNKIFIKLHPSESQLKFKKFLQKNKLTGVEILDPNFLYSKFKNLKIISSDKSQITIDLIKNDLDFFLYSFDDSNFISNFFNNCLIHNEHGLRIYKIDAANLKYIEFKKQYLHKSYDNLVDLENHLMLNGVKPDNESHATNKMFIEYSKNKKYFRNNMSGITNIDDISRNFFNKAFKDLSSDKMFIIESIAYENHHIFYRKNKNFFLDDSLIDITNSFFSPYKFLRAFNMLISIYSYKIAKNKFLTLSKVQNKFIHKSYIFLLIDKFQSRAEHLGPLKAVIHYSIDWLYKLLDRFR